MGKLKSINTDFWSDPFIEDLTPNQKLLFLYLITNERNNMLGCYEISIKKISYDTGIGKTDIEKYLTHFNALKKVSYVSGYILLKNFLKHQKYNANMKTSALNSYNELPEELKVGEIECFETLCKAFVKDWKPFTKSEVEKEIEKEVIIPSENEFLKYAKENDVDFNLKRKGIIQKYNAWKVNGWKTGNNKPIKNWKSTLLNTLNHINKDFKQKQQRL